MDREAEWQFEITAAVSVCRGRNPRDTDCGASSQAAAEDNFSQKRRDLMEAVVERENMERALRRVVSNKGVPGVDGLRVEDLRAYCHQYWPAIKKSLLSGVYMPQAVLGMEIPKPNGGVRQLGIPTALEKYSQFLNNSL